MLYCLVTPRGKFVESTVSADKGECWSRSFDYLCLKLGPEFSTKYWKRWDESIAAGRKLGYKIVKVKLVCS